MGVNFPAFKKLADLRDSLILRDLIHIYPNPSKPIGVCTSYILFVKQTVERILSVHPPSSGDFPLTFKMADGLDGSGSHTIYNQISSNTSTKNYILFCFKPISITTNSGQIAWQNPDQTGLKVDQPDPKGGTSSTGNVARKAFSDECKYIDCVLIVVENQHRPALSRIHSHLAAIQRIFNSDRRVETEKLGNLCRTTYLLILDSFPWASITPKLHKLLAHSEELVRDCNSGYGLKRFSEEGLESCNKLVRLFREKLSRKNSFESNVMDIFVRLASQSDPVLLNFRKILICDICGGCSHLRKCKKGEIELMF